MKNKVSESGNSDSDADDANEKPNDVTSKSLAGPSELVMVMPIKQGLVDCLDTRTYKSRLKTVAKAFSSLRSVSRESSLSQPFADVGDRVRAIYSFHVAVLEPDKLLLAVAFDRPWEPYIRLVWQHLGAFLDPILCNCEGYTGEHSSDLGFEPFAQWIRDHQINTDTFYHFGNQTVDDILYLDQIEKIYRNSCEPTLADRAVAGHQLRNPLDIAAQQRPPNQPGSTEFYEFIKLGVKAITAFHMLTHVYPKNSDDHAYLLRAARMALTGLPASNTWGESFTSIKVLFQTEIQWFENSEATPAASAEKPAQLQRKSLQGGILEGYDANHGCLLLLRITDANQARKFIKSFRKQVTSADDNAPDAKGVYRNIAFTVAGLRRLEISAADIAAFPKEFRDGMEARAGLLGDLRTNHPDKWRLPNKNWPLTKGTVSTTRKVSLDIVDVVIQLRTKNSCPPSSTLTREHPLYLCIETLDKKLRGMQLLSVQVMYSRDDKKEHFGFVDGLSQPFVEHGGKRCPRDKVNAGEVFLGYANDRGDPPQHANSTLRNNGSFLVIRSLAQHVKQLEDFAKAQRADLGKEWSAEKVLAKMMGRTREGMPLVATALQTPHNDFDYSKDPTGEQCPLHSHIRRSQPRDGTVEEKVPRIIRRGMSYGLPYSKNEKQQADRGVIFQAYNASIAEQFEVIQRWISGGNSTATYSRQSDPLLGVPTQGEDRVLTYPQGQNKTAVRLNLGQQPFVTLNWGCYLFVPSLDALKKMGECVLSEQEQEAERGETIISRLQAMPDDGPLKDKAIEAWKQVLEESDSLANGDDQAVWCAIRENHEGILRTPFVLLIADAELIYSVLEDSKRFSVKEYDARLKKCIGENYLGYDSDKHEKAANKPNSIIAKVTTAEAFAVAYGVGQAALQAVSTINGMLDIPLPKYADLVLSVIAKHWFGIPDGPTIADFTKPAQASERQQAIANAFVFAGGQPENGAKKAHCPYHFTSPSRYVFQPNPSSDVEKIAHEEGEVLREKVTAYVNKVMASDDPTFAGTLANDLHRELGKDMNKTEFTSLLMGALLGFMPTVQGNFIISMREWVNSRELWRIQQTYLDKLHQATQGKSGKAAKQAVWPVAEQHLLPSLRRSMAAHPIPAMVHRQATKNVTLRSTQIKKGEKLVLGLVSAAADKKHEALWPVFGGDYHPPEGVNKTTHACPAQNMAIGTLLGMISAFLELPGTLRPTPASLVLALQREDKEVTLNSAT